MSHKSVASWCHAIRLCTGVHRRPKHGSAACRLAAGRRHNIFTDAGLSGATVKRPALTRCLKALRPGDTLSVWKLDRLGRNLRDLITLRDALRTEGIPFQSLTEPIDTAPAAGRAMWQMLGVLAELERRLVTERTHAGVQAAKQRGVQCGPKPQLTPQHMPHARHLRAQGEPVRVIAALFKVHRATLSRVLTDEVLPPSLADRESPPMQGIEGLASPGRQRV